MKQAIFYTLMLALFAISSNSVAQDAGEWGHLTGQILVGGKFPASVAEDVASNPDKAACLVDGKFPLDDGIVVGEKNQLRDVVVLMYTGRGAKEPEKFHPDYEKAKEGKLTLDNKNCRFVPKMLFARPGQTLILKNSDNVGHNCHITTFNHEYNPNIPANKEIELKLGEESDKLPGDVKCDIHKWMDSVIYVRENPYVAFTDADGKFTIKNVPAGDWKFQFWHKKVGFLKTIEIKGYEVNRKGLIDATIKKDESLDLGTMTLPGASFK